MKLGLWRRMRGGGLDPGGGGVGMYRGYGYGSLLHPRLTAALSTAAAAAVPAASVAANEAIQRKVHFYRLTIAIVAVAM